jgi:hypothetical protein
MKPSDVARNAVFDLKAMADENPYPLNTQEYSEWLNSFCHLILWLEVCNAPWEREYVTENKKIINKLEMKTWINREENMNDIGKYKIVYVKSHKQFVNPFDELTDRLCDAAQFDFDMPDEDIVNYFGEDRRSDIEVLKIEVTCRII